MGPWEEGTSFTERGVEKHRPVLEPHSIQPAGGSSVVESQPPFGWVKRSPQESQACTNAVPYECRCPRPSSVLLANAARTWYHCNARTLDHDVIKGREGLDERQGIHHERVAIRHASPVNLLDESFGETENIRDPDQTKPMDVATQMPKHFVWCEAIRHLTVYLEWHRASRAAVHL